ncbi:MAG TPA: SusC/RagA family TonB-linked outer membrane protein [Dinghuibacter sp.]|uniref:SusC/RagA family TonB-linked outer membrane protein n=1 Tax=Dinghuibacter sp. TaxID=2024697 RepID=UPI002BEF0319|nr:SusC/RagA family TonB-linked outer membrane protein [Dinghuibacter sp.]HTJ12340.1 SusC/RagA family TonB-linked outer membrane protein [Dinghuibacter sp.]
MRLQKSIFCWLALFCLSVSVRAQDKTGSVNGIVKNEAGAPVAAVSVIATNLVTGLSAGTATDSSGVFRFEKLPVKGSYSFTFSSVGFHDQTLTGYSVKAGSSLSIFVKLVSQANTLEDVVIVGYGTQKKADITGAVSQVSGEVLDGRSLPNVTQGLEGVIPNLNLVPADGKPIQSATYNIRGTTSIGQGGNALVLIDGIEGDPSLLNPNDIASVTVLKDAASSAIYGARAAFGVVLITTKAPTKGRAQITYSSNFAIKSPTTVPKIVSNGYQYATMFDSAWTAWNDYSQTPQNINKTQPFSTAYLQEYAKVNADPTLPKVQVGSNGNYVYYGNTNWYDLLYKKHEEATDQNISVTGGSGKATYYVTGRYSGWDGLFRYNSDVYKLYTLTAKGSVDVLPWLNISDNTQYSYRTYHNPLNVEEGGGIWRNMADEGHPSSMLQNPDGTLTYSSASTVGDFFYGKNGYNFTNSVIKNTAAFTSHFFGDRFRVKGDLTYESTEANSKRTQVPVPYSVTPGVIVYVGSGTNDIQMVYSTTNYLATNLYGEYENTFAKKHYFKALAGYNYEQSVYNGLTTDRNGLVYSNATDISLALGQNISTSGGYEKWAIVGGFGRLNYAFSDKYLLELDGRYDGSSKFPASQRFAFFPSASAGWRLSKENFWHVSTKAISDLKIRGSYGSLGNGSISSYVFQQNFGISQSGRVINGVRNQETSQPNVLPNGLTWETSVTKDLGLDLSALDNRLTFTADGYIRNTNNMFTVGKTLPAVFGTSVPKGNYADLKTTGWEASIGWKDQFTVARKPFHYNLGFWMSDYTAEITQYNNATKSLTDYYAGMHMGEIWGYTNDGYIQNQADITWAQGAQKMFHASTTGQWLPGDIKFKDIGGGTNGKPDGVINNGNNTATNPGDMRIIGNSLPRYTYGFTLGADWSNFFFSAFFQGVGKRNWYPGSEADVFWGQYNRPYNYLMEYQLGRIWSPTNPNAYFPRYRGYVAQNGQGELAFAQTKYLQKVNYLRLKNLQVGYNLPQHLIRKIGFSGARAYFSGENLWSWSPIYKLTRNIDPESIGGSDMILTNGTNGNGNNYPMLKSVSVGLSVSL